MAKSGSFHRKANWTPEADQALLQAGERMHSARQLAEALGVSTSAVCNRRAALAQAGVATPQLGGRTAE